MKTKIRNANMNDIEQINNIYAYARKCMRRNGNPTQWQNGYPTEEVINEDIAEGRLYVVESDNNTPKYGNLAGVFVFINGDDPCYERIEEGKWRLNKRYGVIHRIASVPQINHFAKTCFDYCLTQVDYLRVDTHRDNIPMQRALQKYGFEKCGLVYVRESERFAYDYV